MKRLLGAVRRADERYGLIAPGARVAVGLSGGKDSLALLYLLAKYRDTRLNPFSLCALTLQIGSMDTAPLESLCRLLDVPLIVQSTDLLARVMTRPNPCALCARIRRGTLVRLAAENGCDTLALGHHRDDALETLLLCALREGRVHTLAPKALMERGGVTVIRPLIEAREEAIADFARRYRLPVTKNPCPADGRTARRDMKDILTRLTQTLPDAKDKLFGAVTRDLYQDRP